MERDMMNFWRIKSFFKKIFFVICITLMVNGSCYGYIIPAEQLLDFMAENFSNFKTMIIVQSTLQTGPESEKIFMEQIQMKSPDLFELKPLDRMAGRTGLPYMAYRQLLMANSRTRLEQLLSLMGINLEAVSLTRVDGVIAYQIGLKGDQGSKLLIEKERFLPLQLVYRMAGDTSEEVVTVRFQDYRKEGKGWFPFQISYSVDNRIREEYSIQNMETNIPIYSSSLQTFEINPSQRQTLE
ncbi:MAG TPA: hypothetical protein VJ373_05960 [Desulfatiglandales bacterium]|nr:hypothetical protein [Desulfatiglandales bacterium]